MNKMRFVTKVVAGSLAASALLLGTLAAPAQATKDTGWFVGGNNNNGGIGKHADTGWF
jgi:Spy/CpxP family protein refolding chaperone